MWMNQRFHNVSEAVANGEDVVPDDITEVHASSAGLKGLCTLLASDGIEDCRKAYVRRVPSPFTLSTFLFVTRLQLPAK